MQLARARTLSSLASASEISRARLGCASAAVARFPTTLLVKRSGSVCACRSSGCAGRQSQWPRRSWSCQHLPIAPPPLATPPTDRRLRCDHCWSVRAFWCSRSHNGGEHSHRRRWSKKGKNFRLNFRPRKDEAMRRKRLLHVGTIVGTVRIERERKSFYQSLEMIAWRSRRDSNPRYAFTAYNGLANRRLQPLGHSSDGHAYKCGSRERQGGRGVPQAAARQSPRTRLPTISTR